MVFLFRFKAPTLIASRFAVVFVSFRSCHLQQYVAMSEKGGQLICLLSFSPSFFAAANATSMHRCVFQDYSGLFFLPSRKFNAAMSSEKSRHQCASARRTVNFIWLRCNGKKKKREV
ncbi:hypothetical protein CLIB1423_18S02234 [[Candida] railenensis]|uniref:Uncharacterized protein n=1 Tax=[Candida] railenensis TaxID=45579 RepID=A0A9P0VZA9_9ASCO|nr:hypothetical protein CLIB1423_18S02234 [[Candida] railenensis]